jgi:hypothetical protein
MGLGLGEDRLDLCADRVGRAPASRRDLGDRAAIYEVAQDVALRPREIEGLPQDIAEPFGQV